MSRTYSGMGQVMKTTDPLGGVTEYAYDGACRPIAGTTTSGYGYQEVTDMDARLQLTAAKKANGVYMMTVSNIVISAIL